MSLFDLLRRLQGNPILRILYFFHLPLLVWLLLYLVVFQLLQQLIFHSFLLQTVTGQSVSVVPKLEFLQPHRLFSLPQFKLEDYEQREA